MPLGLPPDLGSDAAVAAVLLALVSEGAGVELVELGSEGAAGVSAGTAGVLLVEVLSSFTSWPVLGSTMAILLRGRRVSVLLGAAAAGGG